MPIHRRIIHVVQRCLTTELRSLFKDASWETVATAVGVGLYLVEMMLLARYFSRENLGIYFLIVSFPELIQMVLDVRVRELMIRYLVRFKERGEKRRAMALIKLLWLVDVTIALAALLLVLALGRIACIYLLDDPAYAPLMFLYAIGMLFGSLDSASGPVLRVFGRFDLVFWATGAISTISLVLTGLVVVLDAGLYGLVLAKVLTFLTNTLVLGSLSLNMVKRHLILDLRVPLWELREYRGEMLRFAWHVNVSSTFKALAAKLDVIIVGAVLNPAAVAVYKIATQLAKTLHLYSDPLMTAIYLRFSRLAAQHELRPLDELAKRISLPVAAVAALNLVGILLFHRTIVDLYAGEQYVNDAVILVFAVVGNVPAIVFFWVHPYLLSLGLTRFIIFGNITGRTSGIAAFWGLTSVYSLAGAALGFGLPNTLTIAVSLAQVFLWRRRRIKAMSGKLCPEYSVKLPGTS